MFDIRQAGRLLRSDWSSPRELSRELYAMLTSRSARAVESPVTIAVPPGQVALKLSRSAAPAPKETPAVASASKPARPAAGPAAGPSRTPIPPPAGPPPRGLAPPDRRPSYPGTGRFTPKPPAPNPISIDLGPPTPTPGRPGLASAASIAAGLGVPASPPPPARPKILPVDPFEPTTSYRAPVFEVEGAIKAEPGRPVQFDHAPLVLSKLTGRYEPFRLAPDLTKIPREGPFNHYWGKVVRRSADYPDDDGLQSYDVDLYRFPGDDKDSTRPVRFWSADTLNTVAPGTLLYPVIQNHDNSYFYALDPRGPKYAVTTTEIPASAGSELGQGAGVLYLCSKDPSSRKVTLTPTGMTVDIYHGGSKKIPINRRIQVNYCDNIYSTIVNYCA